MKYFLVIFLLVSCFYGCQKQDAEDLELSSGMNPGVLSLSTDNFIKNPRGVIPPQVLNYPGLTKDERNFLIELSNKHEVGYCLEGGSFDDFLAHIRSDPDLRSAMIGDVSFPVDTATMIENIYQRRDSIVEYLKRNSDLKTVTSETRRKYLIDVHIIPGGISAGSIFGLLTAVKDSNGGVTSTMFSSIFEPNANISGYISTWVDGGSYANIMSSTIVSCNIQGDLKVQGTIGGVTFGPTFERVTHHYLEKFILTNPNPGGGGGDDGGGNGGDDGNPGGGGGSVRAYVTSTCTGAEFSFASVELAAAVGMKSYRNNWWGPCLQIAW